MVVKGVGVDIISISRFHKIIISHGIQSSYVNRLALKILHPYKEQPSFSTLVSEQNIEKTALFLSNSWATKEAIYKSLGDVDQVAFNFTEWYKASSPNGKPYIGGSYLKSHKEQFLLSISHDSDTLIAYVLRQQL